MLQGSDILHRSNDVIEHGRGNGSQPRLTDANSSHDFADAPIEVEKHAQIVILVGRLLEDILWRWGLVREARNTGKARRRVREDDSVGCMLRMSAFSVFPAAAADLL